MPLPIKKERKQICVCHDFFSGLTTGARVQVESLVFGCAARVFLKQNGMLASHLPLIFNLILKVIAHGWHSVPFVIKQNQANVTEGQEESPPV